METELHVSDAGEHDRETTSCLDSLSGQPGEVVVVRSKVDAVSQFGPFKPESDRQKRTRRREPGSVLQHVARAAMDVEIKVRSDCKKSQR